MMASLDHFVKHLLFVSSITFATAFLLRRRSTRTAVRRRDDDSGSADLVEVSPGVEVLADYDEPIFFADDFYWVNRGGFWYSSTWYGGGWARAGNVPGHILGISRPEMYRHYRPTGWAPHEHSRPTKSMHSITSHIPPPVAALMFHRCALAANLAIAAIDARILRDGRGRRPPAPYRADAEGSTFIERASSAWPIA